MSMTFEVEARCRVEGLDQVPEDALADLLEAAAAEVERRVPDIAPIVFVEGGQLCALGSFDPTNGRNPFDAAEAFVHELSAGLRAALQQRSIAEVSTAVRELVTV
jgi:hypothetical protein